ncbi:HNH endonuclease [compost metagenome]
MLPIAVKRYVWKRAGACCEHVDAEVKQRCNSKYALQPDHIIPLALGGTDEVSNLQLLCRVHNSRRAIKTFGIVRK